MGNRQLWSGLTMDYPVVVRVVLEGESVRLLAEGETPDSGTVGIYRFQGEHVVANRAGMARAAGRDPKPERPSP